LTVFDKSNTASGHYSDAYLEFEDKGKVVKTTIFSVTKNELKDFAKAMGHEVISVHPLGM
jgi:hypothetical protein